MAMLYLSSSGSEKISGGGTLTALPVYTTTDGEMIITHAVLDNKGLVVGLEPEDYLASEPTVEQINLAQSNYQDWLSYLSLTFGTRWN